jgi:hypothetical protein
VAELWLLGLFVTIPPVTFEALTLIGWIVGGAFVAPLIALGAAQFYLFMRERSTQPMEATIDALYGGASAALALTPRPPLPAAGEGER